MDDPNPYQSPPEWIDEAVDHRSSSEKNSVRYASRRLRLAGAILDCMIVGPFSMILGYFLGLFDALQGAGMTTQEQVNSVLLGITVFVVINAGFIYTRGQTIGKMICGTIVVTRDYQRVSGNRYLFLRLLPMWIISNIPFVGGLFGFADALAIFRSEKNCLHDDIAGTRVIMYREEKENSRAM